MSDLFFGEFSTDVTPPEVTNASPTGAGVLKDAAVEFDITDTETGVDLTTLDVSIGGVPAIVGGAFQTPTYDGTITDMGGGAYHVAVSTHPDFPSYANVGVTVDAQDLAPIPNVMPQYLWDFDVRDYEAPYLENNSPTGIDAPISTLVEFDLKDDGTGVDLTRVIVRIGGVEAYNWDGVGVPDDGFQTGFQGAGSAVTGIPTSYHFAIDANPDYEEWTTYEVQVEARDLA